MKGVKSTTPTNERNEYWFANILNMKDFKKKLVPTHFQQMAKKSDKLCFANINNELITTECWKLSAESGPFLRKWQKTQKPMLSMELLRLLRPIILSPSILWSASISRDFYDSSIQPHDEKVDAKFLGKLGSQILQTQRETNPNCYLTNPCSLS